MNKKKILYFYSIFLFYNFYCITFVLSLTKIKIKMGLFFESFEYFEEKGIEAKKLLYANYVELESFKHKYKNVDRIDGIPNAFIWKFDQERLITAKVYNCENYLKWLANGDYKECEKIINKGWAKNE